MAEKRDFDAVSRDHGSSSVHPAKRHRGQEYNRVSKRRDQQPDTDPNTGQRYVFGSIGDSTVPSDDDLECEDESDALAYLRAVRNEAGDIPNLLVAAKSGPHLPLQPPKSDLAYDDSTPDRSLYENGLGDNRGFYDDGGYVAAPDDEDDSRPAANPVHEAYYASIATQFSSIRAILQQEPPEEAVAALPFNNTPNVGSLGHNSSTFAIWNARLTKSDPLPVQVAAMDRAGAVRLLRIILTGKLLRSGTQVTERTSRWLWALLARLPDRGELDYVDIGYIRDLGKRAVLMMATLAQVAALRAEVELDEGEDDLDDLLADVEYDEAEDSGVKFAEAPPATINEETEEGEVDEDELGATKDPDKPVPSRAEAEAEMEAVRARLLADVDMMGASDETSQSATAPDPEASHDAARAAMNARATLNMILTVAGEFYGQRDLLEFRDPFSGL